PTYAHLRPANFIQDKLARSCPNFAKVFKKSSPQLLSGPSCLSKCWHALATEIATSRRPTFSACSVSPRVASRRHHVPGTAPVVGHLSDGRRAMEWTRT